MNLHYILEYLKKIYISTSIEMYFLNFQYVKINKTNKMYKTK